MSQSGVLEILENADEYIVSKQKMIEKLRCGFFQMALARKSGSRFSIEDCRPELQATSLVNSTANELSLECSHDATSSGTLAVSGLPHRNLKLAQASFLQALQVSLLYWQYFLTS